MEYRLYNKVNCSIFDLIGHDEPSQTKCLGYLLAKSQNAMEAIWGVLFSDDPKARKLQNYNWIVNCELRQVIKGTTKRKESVRADFILRFYENYSPKIAIIIEAKSVTSYSTQQTAAQQVVKYKNEFTFLNRFSKIELFTLTNFINYSNLAGDVHQIKWSDVINALLGKSKKEELIKEFINYYNSIMGTMNFYDAEVLSIPAGKTGRLIEQSYIYECTFNEKGQYAVRAQRRPLYLTFRKGGNNCGRMVKLYKVQDIIVLDFDNKEKINDINKSNKYSDFKNRIEYYYSNSKKPIKGTKYVFVLDKDSSFKLPYPVEYKSNVGINGNKRGHDFLQLKDMLATPIDIGGQKIVKLP